MMLGVILSYSFLGIIFHHQANIMLGLLIVGSIPLFFVYKEKIFKDPIVIIFFLVIIAEILSWINSLVYAPEFAADIPKLDRLGKLFIFFFIAYWLKGKLKNIILLWSFFIFGFLLTVFINVDIFHLFELGIHQPRVNFSIKNAQFDSMLSGASLLITLTFIYFTYKSEIISKKIKTIIMIFLVSLVTLFFYFILITQSRQVWLGLVSILFLAPLIYFLVYKSKNFITLLFTYILIIATVYMLSTLSLVQDRVSQERGTITAIFEEDKTIQMSSIGIRVNSWIDASEWIARHPLLGLDSSAIGEVIQQSKRFEENLKKQFGHLHNFFIEVLVAYGFFGFFLIATLYYFIIKNTQSSALELRDRKFYLFISICFSIYWIVINNFETFNSRHLGIFTHNIIFASFYTFHINHYLKDKE